MANAGQDKDGQGHDEVEHDERHSKGDENAFVRSVCFGHGFDDLVQLCHEHPMRQLKMCERKHERRRWRHRGNFPLFVAFLFIVLTQNLDFETSLKLFLSTV